MTEALSSLSEKLRQTGWVAFTKKLEVNDAQHKLAAMAMRGYAAFLNKLTPLGLRTSLKFEVRHSLPRLCGGSKP